MHKLLWYTAKWTALPGRAKLSGKLILSFCDTQSSCSHLTAMRGGRRELQRSWSRILMWLIHWNNTGAIYPSASFSWGEKNNNPVLKSPNRIQHKAFWLLTLSFYFSWLGMPCLPDLLLPSSFLFALQDSDPPFPWLLLPFFTPR